MTSVLNVGVMSGNPVGNQIRRLEATIETVRNENKMLLAAFESKAPEVHAEYMRLKEEEAERVAAAQRQAQGFTQQSRFPPQIQGRQSGGRF